MELQEFIKETLVQIATGISDAQSIMQDTDCAINPREISGDTAHVYIKNKKHNIQTVNFEIVLTETSGSENKAGIGVALGAIGLGGGNKSNNESVSNTKISFSVPMVFPHVDNENTPVTTSFTRAVSRSARSF